MTAATSAPTPNPRAGMCTPWGRADTMRKVSDQGDVIRVCTSSHGGMGVFVRSRPMPAAFLPLAIRDHDAEWHWFEEDLCWAAVALAFPDLFATGDRESAESTIRNWYPDVYAAHFGRRPTAAESAAVAEEARRQATRDNFIARTAFGDWAWNVPRGHVYVLGERAADGETAGFLLLDKDYVRPNSLVLDGFPRWEPDRSQPYSKT